LSGEEKAEELLFRLSFEDLGLSVCVDMIVRVWSVFVDVKLKYRLKFLSRLC
jgi:hypothetical protein